MLVAKADIQKKLVSEAPREKIFTISVGKPVESNLNHNFSNYGKPVSYTTNPANKPLNLKIHMRIR